MVAYLIPDCGLKTVTPLSQALQRSGLEQFHVESLPEAPSRHPRLGKQSLPRGWASGFISPASCSPFSLHLNIPWRWPGVQPAPNPIFPRQSPSSAPQSPALTAPRKPLPGDSFTEKLRGPLRIPLVLCWHVCKPLRGQCPEEHLGTQSVKGIVASPLPPPHLVGGCHPGPHRRL